MISIDDKVTCTLNATTVWIQLGVCENKHEHFFPSKFTNLLGRHGTRLKTPALDLCKQDRLVSKVNACKKHSWNVHHLPGIILDAWVAVVNETDKVGIFNKFIFPWRRETRSQ